ncbi:MAG: hypothetical protein ACOX2O_04440 [Bdellovibrionota bacterium]|jgi:hypothetical protein
MITQNISLTLDMMAAFLTVIYIVHLLVKRYFNKTHLSGISSYFTSPSSIEKGLLARQHVSRTPIFN